MMGVILALVGIGILVFVVIKFVNIRNNSIQNQDFTPTMKAVHIQLLIQQLNIDYCLGLSFKTILLIAQSPEPIKILQQIIKPGKPTVEEFEANFKKTLFLIIHGIDLSEEEADLIEEDILLKITFDQKTVDFFANCSKNLPPELSFLRGKIDYMVGALVILEDYAKAHDHEYLLNKIQEINQKQGID